MSDRSVSSKKSAYAVYNSKIQGLKKNMFVYILIAPALILTFIFAYIPMPGIIVAFQNFDIFQGIFKSPFVGFSHIMEIFETPRFVGSIFNTLKLSLLTLLIGFPAPIILALLMNELKNRIFKKVVQTISYLPYFLSWISIIGIAYSMLAVYGPLNDLRTVIFGEGAERLMYLSMQELFIVILLVLTLWKNTGWNSVIYLAAISSIDVQLYEAAKIDGATHLQQARYITIPSILPTIVILLIFNLGTLFTSNFELVYGLQNPYINFDVISTVVYSTGLKEANYSMAAAVGFLEGFVAFILTFASNKISKLISGIAIW